MGSIVACPVNCVCSKIEILCNKVDNGNIFPLLEMQDGTNATASLNITDLSKNIISM